MSEQPETEIAIRNVFRDPPIMAGEKLGDYRTLMKLVVKENKPQGLHKMLLARDIVDAEWEYRRLRRIKPDIVNAAIPRVVKSQMAEADEDVALDAKLVPKIRKHVNGMLAGDARARDALEALLKDQHLTVDIITAAAFADTIVPQLHADRMSTAAYERRSSAYAALDRLRQLEQKSSTPPAQAAADDIVDIDDDKHPIAPVDAGAAGQRGDVAPDSVQRSVAVTSAAKIEANRGNAKKSTGPRTPAGKARTRHNAFKHGLCRYASFDAAEDERIEEQKLAFAGEWGDPVEHDLSTLAAEAQAEILRARRAKVVLVNSAAERLVDEKKLPAAQRAASAFARKTKVLLAIERYERRAISRRNRALDALRKSQAERRRRLAIEPVGPPRPKRVRTYKFEQSALVLDFERVLKRYANIRKGTFDFSVQWSSGESIGIQVSLAGDRNSFKLFFSAAGKPIDQQFDLSRTAMRVGGVRWAVQCPETGKWVRDLYLAQGQLHFRSRHALPLTYRSNRLTPEDRHFERCTRLMERVGARHPRDRPPRPKYMRRLTYHILIGDMTEAYADSLRALLGHLKLNMK